MRGFVSYSHHDRKVCEELRKPLKALCRLFPIDEFWIDTATPTGRCFRRGYQQAIDQAQIFVLMISSNSMWSDEIMTHEIPAIQTKQNRDGDLILPVVLDDCLWPAVTGTLLASPRDENLALKPLTKWKPIQQGINQTGQQFQKAISDHFNIEPRQLFHWKSQ